jgi:16S rRNA (guanine527-N7)-methyltransferase
MINKIDSFFDLSSIKKKQLEKFNNLIKVWNQKINLVSRKDIENFEINHIIHSISISKYIDFIDGSDIMDLGTGGGLPGIPLSIIFPSVNFHLVDSKKKKLIL